ncbi:enoyl-CoA hydratase/isomerase family protein [Nonomuraea insulae]|uniref:Enoyl-CoA hydratase/isomerase family protein n=1 Tax=Nonomuraea insulae TaxID=1616787 RepID=A0ABW1DBR6_9ACTN
MTDSPLVRKVSAARWDVVLNREDNRNALSAELVEELTGCLAAARAEGIGLLVLRSSGRVFSAGLDLSDLDGETDATLSLRLARISMLLETVRRAPYLTVALLEGPAVGAGADLALACDLRMGTEAASFRFPGLRFGLVLGTGRLAELVGEAFALDLVLTNGVLDSGTARRREVLEVVPNPEHAETILRRWEAAIDRLPPGALHELLGAVRLTRQAGDGVAEAVRTSAGIPGLQQRIAGYRKAANNGTERQHRGDLTGHPAPDRPGDRTGGTSHG